MKCLYCCAAVACLAALCATAGAADHFSWPSYANKSEDWYRGEEAARVAENVLSWQSAHGSWPKNIDTAAKPYQGDRSRLRGTFDNGATRGEIRFLARAYNATKRRPYRDAVLKAIDHILAAQYPSGGWPQYFPVGNCYNRYITFNDNAMVGVMELLREVAGSDEFAFVDPERRKKAVRAFDRGIECILKCQVVLDGRPTVWCAQHDEITFEPRKGRVYEHVSLSGCESAAVVRLLMSLEEPSEEIVRAVDGACRWFQRSKLTGIRQIERDGDKVIVADADAPPLWARFYQIETNRPIFSGRDGVIKYDVAQIEHERRNGYAWYGRWGESLLDEWPKWKEKHGQ